MYVRISVLFACCTYLSYLARVYVTGECHLEYCLGCITQPVSKVKSDCTADASCSPESQGQQWTDRHTDRQCVKVMHWPPPSAASATLTCTVTDATTATVPEVDL